MDNRPARTVRSRTLETVHYIKTAEAAQLLGLDITETQRLIRTGVLPGVKAPKAGGWHVDRAAVLAYKATTHRGRGPKREITLTPEQLAKLLGDAQHYGVKAEEARTQAFEYAAKRHAAIRAMNDGGLSVRAIAELLGVTPTVVARMLKS